MLKAKYTAFIAGAALAVCFGAQTMAREVVFTEGTCPLTICTDPAIYGNLILEEPQTEAGSETEMTQSGNGIQAPASAEYTLSSFDALGVVNDRYVAIVFDGSRTGYVTVEEMGRKVPDLDVNLLEKVTGWTDLAQGSSGEMAQEAQQALEDLGLLEGGVDGIFGGGTAASVERFQESAGIEVNGVISAAVWFLLLRSADPGYVSPDALETSYPPVYSGDKKFESIIDSVDDPGYLDQFLEPDWILTYDAFKGDGRIDYTGEGLALGTLSVGNRQIDRLALEAEAFVDLKRDDKNVVAVQPVIQVTATGTHRPYITDALLQYGSDSKGLKVVRQDGSLDGQDSVETIQLALSVDIYQMLAAGTDQDTLTLHLKGVSKDYDMDLTPYTENLRIFTEACYNVPIKEDEIVEEILPEPLETETETEEEETEPETEPVYVDPNAESYDLAVDTSIPVETEITDYSSSAVTTSTENPESEQAPAEDAGNAEEGMWTADDMAQLEESLQAVSGEVEAE